MSIKHNQELEELLILSDLSKEQIVEYLPGRYFKYKNKQYECNSCRLLPDNKKFSIITYTNPVVIAYEDIDEITMVHGVVMPPTVIKKQTGPKKYKQVEYTYLMLVKIVNKPDSMSWLELTEELGLPSEQSATIYQKYNGIKKKAAEEELTMNQYVDAIKNNIGKSLKRKLNLKPSVRRQLQDLDLPLKNNNISNEIIHGQEESNTKIRESEQRVWSANNTNSENNCNSKQQSQQSNTNSQHSETTKYSNESRQSIDSDFEKSEQNKGFEKSTIQEQSTENVNQNSSKSQSESKETLNDFINKIVDTSKKSDKEKNYLALRLFDLDETWNKRRYYLQKIFPEYYGFIDKDFLNSFDKPDVNYETTQETQFKLFLIRENQKFSDIEEGNRVWSEKTLRKDSDLSAPDLTKGIFKDIVKNPGLENVSETFVSEKTNIREHSAFSLHQQKTNVTALIDTLKLKRDELQQQLDYHNYLINLYYLEKQ